MSIKKNPAGHHQHHDEHAAGDEARGECCSRASASSSSEAEPAQPSCCSSANKSDAEQPAEASASKSSASGRSKFSSLPVLSASENQPADSAPQAEHSCCHDHGAGHGDAHGKSSTRETTRYICPMCPGMGQDTPGTCAKCGMALERNSAVRGSKTIYTCPMHPEVEQAGPGTCPKCGMALEPKTVGADDDEDDDGELRSMTWRFWVSLILGLPVVVLAMGPMMGIPINSWIGARTAHWIELALTLPIVFWAGGPFFTRAFRAARSGHTNMFTLITLGTTAALGYSAVATIAPSVIPAAFLASHDHGGSAIPPVYYESAAMITALVLLGQVLELRARKRTGSAIRELIALAPQTARVIRDGKETEVPIDEVRQGDTVRVRPGEKIPVDGEVVDGESTIDESMISGESMPVSKQAGDPVYAGSANNTGGFRMQATNVGQETMLSRIIDLVADAQRSRAPIQSVADRVASYFVPAVVVAAIITFVAWTIFGPEDARLAFALTSAVAVLIVACPCALGLATPMSVMVGIGRGAKSGVLIKNAEALERLEKIKAVVVDKTGTLTAGKPRVTEVVAADSASKDDVLRLAAAIESGSEHPLAAAIVTAAEEKKLQLDDASAFQSTTGAGVRGKVQGAVIRVGTPKYLAEEGVASDEALQQQAEELESQGRTVVQVARDQQLIGLIAIADAIKESTPEAIAALHELGLSVRMLTGDNARVAEAVAKELEIDDFEAGLSPEDKSHRIQKWTRDGERVAMAGDGINDAPALAAATVGIAMGTGTDVAIESADVTLLKGDLRGLVKAVRLSKAMMANIRQNLFFAFCYNVAAVPLAAGVLYPVFGIVTSPMIAAAAMSLSSVSVIGNALRLRTVEL